MGSAVAPVFEIVPPPPKQAAASAGNYFEVIPPQKSYGEGTNVTNKAEGYAAKALSGAGLPTSLANIPDWFHHLLGTAKDSEPWWSDIREAIKNPTQENITKAVPLVGPMSVSMAKDVEKGQYGDAAATFAGGLSSVLAAGQVKPGLAAGKAELAEATRDVAGKLTPATRAVSRAAGAAIGTSTLGPGGGVAGALGGPAIADAVLPERPSSIDFKGGSYSEFAGESGKAVPLTQGPSYNMFKVAKANAAEEAAAKTATETPAGKTLQPGGKIVGPESSAAPINKTLVSYSRERLVQMAKGGDVDALRELIRNPGNINVAEAVPNSKYLIDQGGTTKIYGGPVYNPKASIKFSDLAKNQTEKAVKTALSDTSVDEQLKGMPPEHAVTAKVYQSIIDHDNALLDANDSLKEAKMPYDKRQRIVEHRDNFQKDLDALRSGAQ